MNYTEVLNGHTIEFYEDEHLYLVDGVIVPSITKILSKKFGHKYDTVPKEVLEQASRTGTRVHEAIEKYCKTGEREDLPELRGFDFLKKTYGFEVLQNEVPVILMYDGQPIAAGRLDLVLQMDGEIGGADIKRTASLDKEYLAYQLNLYRIAYRQSYGIEWTFLRGIHLRNDVRKFVKIPINEQKAIELLEEYINESSDSHGENNEQYRNEDDLGQESMQFYPCS